MFETSPFSSIWLEISINWHIKSQGPKKKCIRFSRGMIYPCSTHTAWIKVVLLHKSWFVQSFLSRSVCITHHCHRASMSTHNTRMAHKNKVMTSLSFKSGDKSFLRIVASDMAGQLFSFPKWSFLFMRRYFYRCIYNKTPNGILSLGVLKNRLRVSKKI